MNLDKSGGTVLSAPPFSPWSRDESNRQDLQKAKYLRLAQRTKNHSKKVTCCQDPTGGALSNITHTHDFFSFFFSFCFALLGGKNDQFIMCCVESDRYCSTINGTWWGKTKSKWVCFLFKALVVDGGDQHPSTLSPPSCSSHFCSLLTLIPTLVVVYLWIHQKKMESILNTCFLLIFL